MPNPTDDWPPQSLRAWRIDLAQPEDAVTALGAVLSADERERAERFVFPRDRRRFVVTRACLRALLARATGVAATAVRFSYGAQGKPVMEAGAAPAVVHFSVSHSADLAVVALARDLPLGVDIEAVRPMPDVLALARRFFTEAEARAWSVLDLRPAPGFVGALVMRSPPRPLTLVALDPGRDVVPWLRQG
jgi:4'-phosphopantetheinyl transferase